MNIRKLLPLLLALALAAVLVGCASTNEPADTLSPTLPTVTVPAETTPAEDGILSTEVPAATAEPTAEPAA